MNNQLYPQTVQSSNCSPSTRDHQTFAGAVEESSAAAKDSPSPPEYSSTICPPILTSSFGIPSQNGSKKASPVDSPVDFPDNTPAEDDHIKGSHDKVYALELPAENCPRGSPVKSSPVRDTSAEDLPTNPSPAEDPSHTRDLSARSKNHNNPTEDSVTTKDTTTDSYSSHKAADAATDDPVVIDLTGDLTSCDSLPTKAGHNRKRRRCKDDSLASRKRTKVTWNYDGRGKDPNEEFPNAEFPLIDEILQKKDGVETSRQSDIDPFAEFILMPFSSEDIQTIDLTNVDPYIGFSSIKEIVERNLIEGDSQGHYPDPSQ